MHNYTRDKRPRAFNTGDHSYVQQEIGHSFADLAKQMMGDPRIMESVRTKKSKCNKLEAFKMLSNGDCLKQPQYYSDLEADSLAKNLIAKNELIDKHFTRAMNEKQAQANDALRRQIRDEIQREMQPSIDTNNT